MPKPFRLLFPPIQLVLIPRSDPDVPRRVWALILVAAHAQAPQPAPTIGQLPVPYGHPAFKIEQPLNDADFSLFALALIFSQHAFDSIAEFIGSHIILGNAILL